MFGILDRYIGRTVLLAILGCTFMLVGLSSLIKFVEQLQNVGDGTFTTWDAGLRVILLIPGQIVLFFPMAALLGGVVGLGQMASSSELVIFQATGLSRARIVMSSMKTVIPAMILVMLLGEYVAPLGEQKSQDIKTTAVSDGKITATANGIWIKEGTNFINIGALFRDGTLRDIKMYHFDINSELQQIIQAKQAKYYSHAWHMNDAIIVDVTKKERITHQTSNEWAWPTNLTPDKLAVVSVSPDELSGQGLYQYIRYMKANGQNADDYELELWRKVVSPLSVIAMLLLGASTIFGPLRSVSMGARLITGVLIGFTFYVVNQVVGPFSLVYSVPPVVGATLPSVLFMGVAVYLLRRRN